MTEFTKNAQAAQEVVRCACGMDRTGLHLLAYLLQIAGGEARFCFKLDDKGPRSEDLDDAINAAFYFGMIRVESRMADAIIRSFFVAPDVDAVRRSDSCYEEILESAIGFERSDLEHATTGAYLSKVLEKDNGKTYRGRMEKMAKMTNGDRQRVLDSLDTYNRLWEAVSRKEILPKPAVERQEMKDETRTLTGSRNVFR